MAHRSSRFTLSLTAATALAAGSLLIASAPAAAAVVNTPPTRSIQGSNTTLTASEIYGVTVAHDGTIYVAEDGDSPAIEVFAPGSDGNVAPERAISGADTELEDPGAITLDAAGHLWVADYQSNAILEFAANATGDVSPIRTISGASTGLDDNTGIAIGADGTIYAANSDGPSVETFAPNASGNAAPIHTIAGAATGFLEPYGVVLAPDGSIVVSDAFANVINFFPKNADGNVAPTRTLAGSNTNLALPYYAVFDHDGNLYVSDFGDNSVTEYTPNASGNAAPVRQIAGPDTTVSEPYPIAIDDQDSIYVGNYSTSTLAIFAAPLELDSISPQSGSAEGGTTVTLRGEAFSPGARVTIGGTAATQVHVVNSTTITAVTAAHDPGKADVTVTEAGTSSTLAGAFTYTASLAITGIDVAPTMLAAITLLAIGALLLLLRRKMQRAA
jgi:streptogramin lyase